jgi:hypothetical protein
MADLSSQLVRHRWTLCITAPCVQGIVARRGAAAGRGNTVHVSNQMPASYMDEFFTCAASEAINGVYWRLTHVVERSWHV